ncbi:hypothetical protein L207DRAFT_509704 [Hyaloscypha variabilis F]|uniref:Mso1 N-terminal domain-containing protein n=1 Tax=Hyaloscypha variabilis (strain UAMH 11265 / GT02V1 / F) TaxID=1149755 RepID=A0A2J6RXB8_HYAVF|nr:hypothetical protein L207DRAFT_509704 [Hyaloscypha variabilis F]
MTSYFSSLLTTTTSRVASIRQNLLPSENDGDTEDDTHICRVLRAYYSEKGRPFPAWLPPDPKAPPPAVVAPVYAQSNVGARYGGLQNQPGGSGGGGALSSLWDSQPVQQQQDPSSLRQGRGPRLGATAGGPRQNPFSRQAPPQEPQVQPRPLPSARAGSYQQSAGSYGRGDAQTPPGSSAGISAKDRLKGNFNRGRTASPANSAPEPPPTQRGNSYGSSGAVSTSNYEDRFMPTGNGYSGGSGGGSDRPFVAATAPWATNESEFTGGYGGGGGRPRPTGLPSGPAAGKRR